MQRSVERVPYHYFLQCDSPFIPPSQSWLHLSRSDALTHILTLHLLSSPFLPLLKFLPSTFFLLFPQFFLVFSFINFPLPFFYPGLAHARRHILYLELFFKSFLSLTLSCFSFLSFSSSLYLSLSVTFPFPTTSTPSPLLALPQCLPQCWYTAVDFQLYVVAPLVLAPLLTKKRLIGKCH